MHSLIELALELITEDGKEKWGYYFADHDKRIIFWFEDHESRPLMNKIRGVERKSHISEFFPRSSFYFVIALLPGYALEAQYWFAQLLAVCLFPHTTEVHAFTLCSSPSLPHQIYTS
jgi:hypothetical protein